MSRRIKLLDDEFKAKKVWTKIEVASNTVYNYKNKIKAQEKDKSISYKQKSKLGDNKRGKEVVVKITGNSKNFDKWKAHIKYITRNFELPLYDTDGIEYKGKDDINDYIDFYNFDGAIPTKNLNKERREVMHLVFSMQEHQNISPDKLMKAVSKTMKEKYPNNPMCFSYHGDTKNPHIHCDLKMQDINGKRIDIKHKDRYDFRREFAKNLNDLGIEAYATFRNQREQIQKEQLNELLHKEKTKNHHYEVVDFGKAKYNFKEDEKDSFFVQYKTTKGEITTIWSEDLERVLKENNIQIGEFAKFKIVDKEPKEISVYKTINGKRKKVSKTVLKNRWDCSVYGRAEKELNKSMSSYEKVKYNIEDSSLHSQLYAQKNAEFAKKMKEKKLKEQDNIQKTKFGQKSKFKTDDKER